MEIPHQIYCYPVKLINPEKTASPSADGGAISYFNRTLVLQIQ